jgi:hypothetical protein
LSPLNYQTSAPRLVPGARIEARDALWSVVRVINNSPGKLVEAKGLDSIVRGKEAIFIDLIEPSLKVVSPVDVELVIDRSAGFEDTRLFLEAAFRTSAPTGPYPLVIGKAAIDDLSFQHVPVIRADQKKLRPRPASSTSALY